MFIQSLKNWKCDRCKKIFGDKACYLHEDANGKNLMVCKHCKYELKMEDLRLKGRLK